MHIGVTQLVRQVGIAFGILKPIAGKLVFGEAPLTTDPLALASVCLVLLFALYFFITRALAHCTCSKWRAAHTKQIVPARTDSGILNHILLGRCPLVILPRLSES